MAEVLAIGEVVKSIPSIVKLGINLVICAVAVFVLMFGFVVLSSYHLVTAFIFFIAGYLVAALASGVSKQNQQKVSLWLFLVPIGLGALGYMLEYFRIFKLFTLYSTTNVITTVPYDILGASGAVTIEFVMLVVMLVLTIVNVAVGLTTNPRKRKR